MKHLVSFNGSPWKYRWLDLGTEYTAVYGVLHNPYYNPFLATLATLPIATPLKGRQLISNAIRE